MVQLFLMALIIVACVFFIIKLIDKTLVAASIKLQEQLLYKARENELLYKAITHIYKQLSLLKLKDCPEEKFKNIPFETIEWIEQLMGEQNMNVKK